MAHHIDHHPTYAADGWCVSTERRETMMTPMHDKILGARPPEPSTISVFIISNRALVSAGLAKPNVVPHPLHDGLMFDAPGDAEWYLRQVGLVKPWRPDTEGT